MLWLCRLIEVSDRSIVSAVHTFTASSSKREAGGHHPDHLAWRVVEPDRRADGVAAAGRGRVVGENRQASAALRFIVGERAPAGGLDAKHVEELSGNRHCEDALGGPV